VRSAYAQRFEEAVQKFNCHLERLGAGYSILTPHPIYPVSNSHIAPLSFRVRLEAEIKAGIGQQQ